MLSGRRKLLLADDSPTIQKVISLTFGDEGMEVVAVGDGERAIEALDSDAPPDILLADVLMPGPNGYELCERVRADERLRHVPVVLLVGKFEPFNEAEARRVGADTFLTKPFQSIRDLVSRVGSLLGGDGPKHEEAAREEHARAEETSGEASAPHAEAHQEPVAQTAEYNAGQAEEAHAQHEHAFADFAADDELIEAKPADSFVAPSSQAEPAAAEFNTLEQPFADTHFDSHAMPDSQAPSEAHAETHAAQEAQTPSPELAPATTHAASPREAGERVMAAHASFSSRAASAAVADDALLDLGQFDSPASSSAAEADDFVLDLEDDSSLEAAPARHGSAAFDTHSLDDRHAARTFVEPEVVPADAPVPAAVEGEFTDGSVEGDVPRPPAFGYDTKPAFESAAHQLTDDVAADETDARENVAASEPSPAAHAVGEARVGVEETPRAGQLSPDEVERIARRVVELMSDSVVREIAWEVVPELAELLIKQRLDGESQK